MYCTKCGNRLEDNVKFCTDCGTRVENTAQNKAVPAAKPKTGSNTVLKITVIIMAAVIAFMGVYIVIDVIDDAKYAQDDSGAVADPADYEGMEFEVAEDFAVKNELGSIILDNSDVESIGLKLLDKTIGDYVIYIELNSFGKELFAEATANNIGRPLHIFVGETKVSSPTVNEAITDGFVILTPGDDNAAEMLELLRN